MATKKPKTKNRHNGEPIMTYTTRKKEFKEKAAAQRGSYTMAHMLRILIDNFLDEVDNER